MEGSKPMAQRPAQCLCQERIVRTNTDEADTRNTSNSKGNNDRWGRGWELVILVDKLELAASVFRLRLSQWSRARLAAPPKMTVSCVLQHGSLLFGGNFWLSAILYVLEDVYNRQMCTESGRKLMTYIEASNNITTIETRRQEQYKWRTESFLLSPIII